MTSEKVGSDWVYQAAPDAEEAIKYQLPTFVLKGDLVHFAAYKKHIGFYPVPTGIEALRNELSVYKVIPVNETISRIAS